MNPVGELSNLRHTGTVDEYCSQFEECLSRQTRLSGDQQLWQFCAGLTDSLRKEVEYLRPETIFEAIEYARDNEYKIDNDKRTRTFGGHLAPITKTLGVSARQENRGSEVKTKKIRTSKANGPEEILEKTNASRDGGSKSERALFQLR